MEPTVMIVGFVVLVVTYFTPAIIASCRYHHQENAITILNLCLGWTLLGWIVALVWSVSDIKDN